MTATQRPLPARCEVVSVKQAADILGEHYKTTYERLRTGQLHGVQYVKGGRWWITRADIEEFLDPEGYRARRTA